MPPRDGAVPSEPAGTSRISGRVVAADTGAPLRRAQVRISAAELRVNRSATTDAEGRYEFPDLPAGRYNVSVSRSGFVSLSFGQRRPFEQGRPLDLGSAQEADRIDFALPRGGVIAGRVTDELGEPLAGVRVQAMRYQYLPNGRRQLTPVSGGGLFGGLLTNDLGEFRLYSLMPGTYVVSATPADTMVMMPGPACAGVHECTRRRARHHVLPGHDQRGRSTVDYRRPHGRGERVVRPRAAADDEDQRPRPQLAGEAVRGKPEPSDAVWRWDVDARACGVWPGRAVQCFQRAAGRALHRNLSSRRGRRGIRVGTDHGRRPGHHRPDHHDKSRGHDLRTGDF